MYQKIAEKGKYPNPYYSWIPLVGPGLISSKLAKMSSEPLYLLLGILLIGIPIIKDIGSLALFIYMIYFIIWNWKIFEGFKKPGWFSVFWILFPIEAILLGIVAFGKNKFNPKLIRS